VTGEGNFGYTTWTFWPAKTDNYIIQELDAVFTGDITSVQYQEEQQALFDEEKTAGKVPPSPPTQSTSK
jgi:raffinose/stachyose/melibiose transport system substrate-binding protein